MSLKEKIKIFLNNFRSLPLSTKRLLSLGMVLALVVALPLFVWAIVSQRFDIRERAATGERPTPTPTPIGTVTWSTQWASFSATDYRIQVQVPEGTENGRIFRVNPSKPCNLATGEMVCVRSDSPDPYPQGLHYMTLEVTWFEYDIEMRMFVYLWSDGKKWWSNEIRVYNGQPYPNTEWVYYYGKFFDTPVGQVFTQSKQFRLSAPDPKTNGPVTLSFSNVRFAAFLNYFKPTPTPTVKPTPTPTPVCKTGVNSFSVDTPCGTNRFRYMTFKCYDGYGGREGGPTSCKTSETWRSYAEKICEGRSNCPTPTPKAKPTPTAWPSPRPTPTPIPRPTPTVTPIPPRPPNRNPVIDTKSLPIAIYGKYYSTEISGYDWNKNDKLSMGIGGLPRGIKVAGCSNFFDKNGRNTITCKISGVPQSTGRHYVSVSLTDGNGGAAYKNFILWVFKPFFLK